MLQKTPYISFGSDPELFLAKDGMVIGAEKVIPKAGLIMHNTKLVLDGVQIELHPVQNYSIPNFCNSVGHAFSALKDHLDRIGGNVKPCFTQTVFVDPSELATLSKEARVLGCAPSENFYNIKRLEPKEGETQRSAGGHIHIGLNGAMFVDRISLVPIHDVITANTGVLLDRDPHAALRRKMYGRPGEYRLPSYGIEYRTLSNWWLRSRPTMEFVFGLSQLSCDILNTSLLGDKFGNPEQELFDKIDLDKIVQAVMTNDAKLAYENWKLVRDFIQKWVTDKDYPIHAGNLVQFEKLIDRVAREGSLDSLMPADPVEHWTSPVKESWSDFLNRALQG